MSITISEQNNWPMVWPYIDAYDETIVLVLRQSPLSRERLNIGVLVPRTVEGYSGRYGFRLASDMVPHLDLSALAGELAQQPHVLDEFNQHLLRELAK